MLFTDLCRFINKRPIHVQDAFNFMKTEHNNSRDVPIPESLAQR
jgi:hypothetical protein